MVTLVLPFGVISSTLLFSFVQSVVSGTSLASEPQSKTGNVVLLSFEPGGSSFVSYG